MQRKKVKADDYAPLILLVEFYENFSVARVARFKTHECSATLPASAAGRYACTYVASSGAGLLLARDRVGAKAACLCSLAFHAGEVCLAVDCVKGAHDSINIEFASMLVHGSIPKGCCAASLPGTLRGWCCYPLTRAMRWRNGVCALACLISKCGILRWNVK